MIENEWILYRKIYFIFSFFKLQLFEFSFKCFALQFMINYDINHVNTFIEKWKNRYREPESLLHRKCYFQIIHNDELSRIKATPIYDSVK